MKKYRLIIFALFLFSCVFFVVGCATYQYEGNNIPPFSSPHFPSFDSVREIPDNVKYRFAEGSWKTKTTKEMTFSKGQQQFSGNITSDETQYVNVENNLVSTNTLTTIISNMLGKRETSTTNYSVVYETNGKIIRFDDLTMKENVPPEVQNQINKTISNMIKDQFARLGKTVMIGDSWVNMGNMFSGIKELSGQTFELSSIVKGVGVYKDKTVIVVETTGEINIHGFEGHEGIVEMKMKGYALLDAEAQVPVFGEVAGFLVIFTPKQGTIHGKFSGKADTYEVKVKNVIDSPNFADIQTTKESSKQAWSEASDKIKALGELFQKSLISKEEYEMKKNELLKNF